MRRMRIDWKAVMAAAALALIASCGKEEPAAPAEPVAEAPAQTGGELNLFAWSEYLPQGVIDDFTAETGIQVNFEQYASYEEMLAKLTSSAAAYDLVQPSEYTGECSDSRS